MKSATLGRKLGTLLPAALCAVAAFAGGARAGSFYVAAKPTLCVDLSGGRVEGGNRIQLWTCHGKAPQLFTVDPAGRVRYAANPAWCVEQEQGGGRLLELTECAHTWNKWRYDQASGRIMGDKGVCWDVPSGKFNQQQRMQVWKCHNFAPQNFIFRD